MIIDVHTHNRMRNDAIISLNPHEFRPEQGKYYSVGIHPWITDSMKDINEEMAFLERVCLHERVVAIGETGIDKLRGADLTLQRQIFERHIRLSEALNKPLIIHNVRATNETLELYKKYKPLQPWILHGFRGNAHIVHTVLKNSEIYVSFGEKYSVQSLCETPMDRILIETDESKLSINEIAKKIAADKDIGLQSFMRSIKNNIEKSFNFV